MLSMRISCSVLSHFVRVVYRTEARRTILLLRRYFHIENDSLNRDCGYQNAISRNSTIVLTMQWQEKRCNNRLAGQSSEAHLLIRGRLKYLNNTFSRTPSI